MSKVSAILLALMKGERLLLTLSLNKPGLNAGFFLAARYNVNEVALWNNARGARARLSSRPIINGDCCPSVVLSSENPVDERMVPVLAIGESLRN